MDYLLINCVKHSFNVIFTEKFEKFLYVKSFLNFNLAFDYSSKKCNIYTENFKIGLYF